VLHIDGGQYADRIEIIRVSQPSSNVLEMEALPSRAFDGSISADFDGTEAYGRAQDERTINWRIVQRDDTELSMSYGIQADTLRGSVGMGDDGISYPLFGVRIDEGLVVPPVEIDDDAPADSTALVVLRVDDNMPTDPAFTSRLLARGIPAEIAVPTAGVGKDGRPSWADLHALEDAGFGIVAHSRLHVAGTNDGVDFMGEVLGSLSDLSQHGFSSRIFVQPGVWTGSIFFDSLSKTRNWRGALLRTFSSASELYQIDVPLLRPWSSSRIGISHRTISDGATPEDLLLLWARVQRKNYLTVLLVHTLHVQPVDKLDWFLDSLAVANRDGRIRLMRSVDDAFAR
jgi:hypothetical protein